MKALLLCLMSTIGIGFAGALHADYASLSADYCYPLSRKICSSTITVQGHVRAPILRVTVSLANDRSEKLFACFDSRGGSQEAAWIQYANPAIFHLYAANNCYGNGGQEIDRLVVDGR